MPGSGLSRIESGRTEPRPNTVRRICCALALDPRTPDPLPYNSVSEYVWRVLSRMAYRDKGISGNEWPVFPGIGCDIWEMSIREWRFDQDLYGDSEESRYIIEDETLFLRAEPG